MKTEKSAKQNTRFPLDSLDVLEQGLLGYDELLLKRLLKDQTTKENIKWNCDDYCSYGEGFRPDDGITVASVTDVYATLIQPRAAKEKCEQEHRTREKAEVFTPSWLCNIQNNMVDEAWFGRSDVFNRGTDGGWTVKRGRIEFPNVKGKTWQDYVDDVRLELACGEAPYLVSRYDTVSGEIIPVTRRIGLLDRKLRIVGEHAEDQESWFTWAERAFQSTYGFDLQGDNVLLARENLLYSFVDYFVYRFGCDPEKKLLRRIAHIISWNIWQMDGISMTAPFSKSDAPEQIEMDFMKRLNHEPEQIEIEDPAKRLPCRIMDWRANKSIEFRSLLKGDR